MSKFEQEIRVKVIEVDSILPSPSKFENRVSDSINDLIQAGKEIIDVKYAIGKRRSAMIIYKES